MNKFAELHGYMVQHPNASVDEFRAFHLTRRERWRLTYVFLLLVAIALDLLKGH